MDAILRPADDLAPVVRGRRVAVVAAGKRRQRRHDALLPAKAFADLAGRRSGSEEGPAGEGVLERGEGVVLQRVGDADDDATVVLHGPGDGAVGLRPAQRAQVQWHRATDPQCGTRDGVTRLVGLPGDPATVVDAVGSGAAAEPLQGGHLVGLGCHVHRQRQRGRDHGRLDPTCVPQGHGSPPA